MSTPIPIIVCGRSSAIATDVIAICKPEYEVTHAILSASAGIRDLPYLLRGEAPPPSSSSSSDTEPLLGTANYSQLPLAIAVGGGFEDQAVEDMKNVCKNVDAGKRMLWLRPDYGSEKPKLGPGFGKILGERLKEKLKQLRVEGWLEGKGEREGGEFLF